MPPTTPADRQRAARRVEVQELLRDQELTIPRWCALALEQPEIKTIQLYKYTDVFLSRSTRIPYEVNRGADLDHIEGLVTEKYGPGTYLFSAVGSDGKFWARKGASLGVIPDPPPGAPPPASMPDHPEMTLDATMKAALLRRQVRGFLTDEDTSETNRQLAPMKLLTEMLSVLKPAGDGGTDKLLAFLMQENAETKRLLLEVLTKGGPAGRHDERDPVTTSIETLDRVMAIAGRLGFTKAEGGGGSMWTPEGISMMVSTAAPLLKDGLDALKVAMGHGARVAGTVVDGTAEYVRTGAQAVADAVGPGPEGARMKLSEVDKELVEIGYAALQSKDFPTVEMVYNAIRPLTGGFLPELNPDVNPALYVNLMRRFDARFELVRAEWAMFLLWLKEQESLTQAEVDAGGEPERS